MILMDAINLAAYLQKVRVAITVVMADITVILAENWNVNQIPAADMKIEGSFRAILCPPGRRYSSIWSRSSVGMPERDGWLFGDMF